MSVRVMYRCKRCGELWPGDDLHRHAACCFDDLHMDPDTVRDCYQFSHFYQEREPGESQARTTKECIAGG